MKLNLLNNWIGVLLILLSISGICKTQVSKGDMCIGTGHTNGCDHELTNLHCYESKCQCPEALTMPTLNIPSNLNTRWSKQAGKCFAVKGSLCDLHPQKKRVDCWAGLECVPNPENPTASGICSGSSIKISIVPFILLLITIFKLT